MFWKSKQNVPPAEQTPAENLAIARLAFREGDTKHATQHIAWALQTDPHYTEALVLLNQIIATSVDADEVTAWDKTPFPYPLAAVRAYIYARQGRINDALSLMGKLYRADIHSLPFLDWVVEWVTNSTNAPNLDPQAIGSLVMALAARDERTWTTTDRDLLIQLLPTFVQCHDVYPENTNVVLFLSILHRKLRKLDEALALAQETHDTKPTGFSATVLGNAYRSKGMIDLAVAMFREALTYQPDDIAIRLDIADTLCDNGRIGEGLAVYQEVLKHNPEHEWAYPSFLYFNGLLDLRGDWFKKLGVVKREEIG